MFNIQSAFAHRVTPDYTEDIVTFCFETEVTYDNWFKLVGSLKNTRPSNPPKSSLARSCPLPSP